jgi:hypothetical protein
VALAEIGEILLLKLIEQPLLVFGDDAVADAGENNGMAIVGDAPHREHHHEHDAGQDDGVEIAIDVGLIDDVARQIGRQAGRACADSHQHKCDSVAMPAGKAVVGQQPPDHPQRGVGIGKRCL